jgi:hypothetical protein
MYLLEQQRFLLRVDDVSLSPVAKSLELDARMRCTTLVMDLSESERAQLRRPGIELETQPSLLEQGRKIPLASQERERFAPIVARDVFRPYMKPPPAPPPKPKPKPGPRHQPQPSPPPPPPEPPRPSPRLVGLPAWSGRPTLMLRDPEDGAIRRYEIGQRLAGGLIVGVDYRKLPNPLEPQMLSPSRAILRFGPDLWAVELGHTLEQRRRLSPGELPEPLPAGWAADHRPEGQTQTPPAEPPNADEGAPPEPDDA